MPVDNRVGHEKRQSGSPAGIIKEGTVAKPDDKTYTEHITLNNEPLSVDALNNPDSSVLNTIQNLSSKSNNSPNHNATVTIELDDNPQNSNNMSDNKLTYEMKSPGEAWMDHVNNDLNAKAVTPAYLDPETQQKEGGVAMLEKIMKDVETERNASPIEKQPEKPVEKDIEPEK